MTQIEFGLDTFGDISLDDAGNPKSAGQVIRDVVEQAKLADQLGLAGFNIGEHHRDDFAVSAPDTVLAGIATVTKNIRLALALLSCHLKIQCAYTSASQLWMLSQTVEQKLPQAAGLSSSHSHSLVTT